MLRYSEVIFVGTENTCRSLMAEAILNGMMEKAVADKPMPEEGTVADKAMSGESSLSDKAISAESALTVKSRGLVVLFPEPYNPKAEAVLVTHNLTIKGRTSKQLAPEDITSHTLILTMTLAQKIKAVHEYGHLEQIYSLNEYIGEEGDVMDPYGEELPAYEECYRELCRLIEKAVVRIKKEEKKDDSIGV